MGIHEVSKPPLNQHAPLDPPRTIHIIYPLFFSPTITYNKIVLSYPYLLFTRSNNKITIVRSHSVHSPTKYDMTALESKDITQHCLDPGTVQRFWSALDIFRDLHRSLYSLRARVECEP